MFKVAQVKKVTWPVTVNVPQDGGRTMKATFSAEIEVIDRDEQRAVLDANGDLLDRQLVGWSNVKDADGNDFPFNDENKKKLLGIPYVCQALYEALGQINTGREAARKN